MLGEMECDETQINQLIVNITQTQNM